MEFILYICDIIKTTIMKSSELSQTLQDLELKASKLFNELLEQKPEFNFLQSLSGYEGTDDEIEELLCENEEVYILPTIEARGPVTGNVFDIHVMSVDENGIYCMLMNDTTITSIYSFSDLCSLEDALILLNEMEELLK